MPDRKQPTPYAQLLEICTSALDGCFVTVTASCTVVWDREPLLDRVAKAEAERRVVEFHTRLQRRVHQVVRPDLQERLHPHPVGPL